MQIQVNSDTSVAVDTDLMRFVEAEVGGGLTRFEPRITRVEVHLSDVNSHKTGPQDLRCLLEARPAGHEPVTVSNRAETIEAAVKGATDQLARALDTLFGRLLSRT